MAILDRVGTLIRANINDLLDRAEDPEKMIKQLLQDMENQLIQVKTQVAAAIADEQRLKERWELNQQQADEWQRKAELAVQKGQDDLAKEALARRNTFQQTAAGFKEQYEEQAKQVEQLKDALDKLEAKIQEARTKKDLLIARSRRAQAEQQIHETMARADTTNVTGGFERMEEKIRMQEARAKALGDLDHDTVDERFRSADPRDHGASRHHERHGRLRAHGREDSHAGGASEGARRPRSRHGGRAVPAARAGGRGGAPAPRAEGAARPGLVVAVPAPGRWHDRGAVGERGGPRGPERAGDGGHDLRPPRFAPPRSHAAITPAYSPGEQRRAELPPPPGACFERYPLVYSPTSPGRQFAASVASA